MGTFFYLWIVQQLPCFLFGMIVFKWMAEGRAVRWPRALVLASLLAMVLVAFFPGLPLLGRLDMPKQYGIFFAVFAVGLAHWQPLVLVNPLIGWIGKVSFSSYLIHLWLISAFPIPHANYPEAFFALTAITLAISLVTYLVIEKPCNRLGRYLARRVAEAGSPLVSPGQPEFQEIVAKEK